MRNLVKRLKAKSILFSGLRIIKSLCLCFALIACSSSPTGKRTFTLQDTDSGSTAHGAAYTGSAMFIRRPMPSHSDWQPQAFYYKVCEQSSAATYYSRTSYSCNEK